MGGSAPAGAGGGKIWESSPNNESQKLDPVEAGVYPGGIEIFNRFVEPLVPDNFKTPSGEINVDYAREQILRDWSDDTFERAMIIDADGKEVSYKTGNSNSVSFAQEETRAMALSKKELELLHNHPNAQSYVGFENNRGVSALSKEDVDYSMAVGMKSITAFNQDAYCRMEFLVPKSQRKSLKTDVTFSYWSIDQNVTHYGRKFWSNYLNQNPSASASQDMKFRLEITHGFLQMLLLEKEYPEVLKVSYGWFKSKRGSGEPAYIKRMIKEVWGEMPGVSELLETMKGGKGSGHHGHAGRPGLVGGSAPAGAGGGIISESSHVFDGHKTLVGASVDEEALQIEGMHNHKLFSAMARDVSERALDEGVLVRHELTDKYMQDVRTPDGFVDKEVARSIFRNPDFRKMMKRNIVQELSKRSGVDEKTVHEIVHEWSAGASGTSKASEIQEVIAETFGVTLNRWQQKQADKYNKYNQYINEVVNKEIELQDEFIKKHGDKISAWEKETGKKIFETIDFANNGAKIRRTWVDEFNSYTRERKDFEAFNDFVEMQDKFKDYIAQRYTDTWLTTNDIPGREVFGYLVSYFRENQFSKNTTENPGMILVWYEMVGGRFTPESWAWYFNRNDLRKVVKAMYSYTQNYLKKVGFKKGDKVRLFRGIRRTSTFDPSKVIKKSMKGKFIDWKPNAAESWTTNLDTAKTFGGIVLQASMPIENIVTSCMTGLGCLHEEEFIASGMDLVRVKIASI